MSLVGSLEDLGLGDILQIISLSRKSGVLTLRSRDGEGQIFFCGGEVRGARLKDGSPDLRSLLTAASVPASAIETAERQNDGRSLRDSLLEQRVLASERLEAILLAHLESVVARMFRWETGEFSFEVRDEWREERDLFVSVGVSAQFLAMEGARQLDEGASGARRRSAAKEAEPAPRPAPRAPRPPRDARAPAVVVLDPELPVLEWIKGALKPVFPRVHIFQHADQAVARVRQYLARAEELLLLLSADASGDRLTGARNAAEIAARLKAHSRLVSILLLARREAEPAGFLLRAADGLVLRPGPADLRTPEAAAAFVEVVGTAFETYARQLRDPDGRGDPTGGETAAAPESANRDRAD